MTVNLYKLQHFKSLPKRNSMIKSSNISFWEIFDKGCKHYDKNYHKGFSLANQYLQKAAKDRQSISSIIDSFNSKYPKNKSKGLYFFRLGFFDCINEIDSNSSSYTLAEVTSTVYEKNNYLLTKYRDTPITSYISNEDYWIKSNYKYLLSQLLKPYFKYMIEPCDDDCQSILFNINGCKGYISVNIQSNIYGEIVFDNSKSFNKVKDCPVKINIPNIDCKNMDNLISNFIKETKYLGSKKGYHLRINSEYIPKYFNR